MNSQPRSRALSKDGTDADLAAQLAALPGLSREVLKERWRALWGTEPPSHLGRLLLVRAIAYRLQEEVFGGLDAATRKRLVRAGEDLAAGRALSKRASAIKPGTRLLREWQGAVHEVIVLERGVQYRGKTWDSLSAVAREITGTRWSGPLFFGLTGRRERR